MNVPPRSTTTPAALDGYRRIATTSTASTPATEPARPAVRASRRTVGAIRIVAMLSVLALVAGTSFALATADPRKHGREQTAARASSASTTGELLGPPAPAARVLRSPRRGATSAASAAAATRAASARATAAPAAPVAPATTSATTAPSTPLPFTGAREDLLLRVVLGGSVLALLGMLVQIAGTPLPAQASSRTRRASRAT